MTNVGLVEWGTSKLNEQRRYGPAGSSRRAVVAQGKGRPMPQVYLGHTGRPKSTVYLGDHNEQRHGSSWKWLASTMVVAVVAFVAIGFVIYGSVDSAKDKNIGEAVETWSREAVETRVVTTRRSSQLRVAAPKSDKLLMSERGLSTKHIIHDTVREQRGGREFITIKPYARIVSMLATAAPENSSEIPTFNPLKLYAVSAPVGSDGNSSTSVAADDQVAVKVLELAGGILPAEDGQELAANEIAKLVARTGEDFNPGQLARRESANASAMAGASEAAASARFDTSPRANPLDAIPANTAVLAKNVVDENDDPGLDGQELRVVRLASGDSVEGVLAKLGTASWQAKSIVESMQTMVKASALRAGYELRLTTVPSAINASATVPIKMSVYTDGQQHLVTVSRDESGDYVASESPIMHMAAAPRSNARRATLYESLYRTALSQNLPSEMINRIIRIHAYDTDFKRRVGPGDNFEAFFDVVDDESANGSDESTGGTPGELLSTSISIAGESRRFYRFRTPDGVVDYYDEEGNNAKRFLIRKPVRGNGIRFTSGFGLRFHPLLRQRKMHTGVDWSGPTGTPIISAGNGVIEEAGRKGGYGNHIRIRHANGYQSTYSHMSRFASGVVEGAKVRQGQVIGYIGTTGLSSGPHLHFEILVNKSHVDPMRIHVPRERQLTGKMLADFAKERMRIDDLMSRSPVTTRVAEATGSQ